MCKRQRNALCALTSEQISSTPDTLLATMLRSDVRVGTSTPKADPSGDYAWALFRQADKIQPGAYAQLDAKALKLTGGADSPKPPAGRGTYALSLIHICTLLRVLHGLADTHGGGLQCDASLRQAMLFQRPHMLRTSAQNNVALALWLRGTRWRDARPLALTALQRVGLQGIAAQNLSLIHI